MDYVLMKVDETLAPGCATIEKITAFKILSPVPVPAYIHGMKLTHEMRKNTVFVRPLTDDDRKNDYYLFIPPSESAEKDDLFFIAGSDSPWQYVSTSPRLASETSAYYPVFRIIRRVERENDNPLDLLNFIFQETEDRFNRVGIPSYKTAVEILQSVFLGYRGSIVTADFFMNPTIHDAGKFEKPTGVFLIYEFDAWAGVNVYRCEMVFKLTNNTIYDFRIFEFLK